MLVVQRLAPVVDVVAEDHVLAGAGGAHGDRVRPHAAGHHLVAQDGGGVGLAQGDAVGAAGGVDQVGGQDVGQAALDVEAHAGVVAHHVAAAATLAQHVARAQVRDGVEAGHPAPAGAAVVGAGVHQAARHAQAGGDEVDGIAAVSAEHQLEAFFQGDAVVAADHRGGVFHLAQDAVLGGNVVIELGVVARHEMVAVATDEDVGAEAAEDHLAAVAGGDDVVAPLLGHGARHLEHEVRAIGRRLGQPADLAVVAEQDVLAQRRAGADLAGNRIDAAGHQDLVGAHAAQDEVFAQHRTARQILESDLVGAPRLVLGVQRVEIGESAEGVERQLGVVAGDVAQRVARRLEGDHVGAEAPQDHLVAVGGDDRVVAPQAQIGRMHVTQGVGRGHRRGVTVHLAVVAQDDVDAGPRRPLAQHGNAVCAHAAGDDVEADVGRVARRRGVSDAEGVRSPGRRRGVGGDQIGQAAGGVEGQGGVVAGEVALGIAGGVHGDAVGAEAPQDHLVAVGGDDRVVAPQAQIGRMHVTQGVGRGHRRGVTVHLAVVAQDDVDAGPRRPLAQHGNAVCAHAAGDDVEADVGRVARRRGVSDAEGVRSPGRRRGVGGDQIGQAAGGVEGQGGVVAGEVAIGAADGIDQDAVRAISADNHLVAVGGDDGVAAALVQHGTRHRFQQVGCGRGLDRIPAGDLAVVAEDHVAAVGGAVRVLTGHAAGGGAEQDGVGAHAGNDVVAPQVASDQVVRAAHRDQVVAAAGRRRIQAAEQRHPTVIVGVEACVVTANEARVGTGRSAGGKGDAVAARPPQDDAGAAAQADDVVAAGPAHFKHRRLDKVQHVLEAVEIGKGQLAARSRRSDGRAELHRTVVGQDDVLGAGGIGPVEGVLAVAGQGDVAAAAQVDQVAAAGTAETHRRQGLPVVEVDLDPADVGQDGVVALARPPDIDDVAALAAEDDIVAAAALQRLPAGRGQRHGFQGLALPDPVAAGGAELRGPGRLQAEVVRHGGRTGQGIGRGLARIVLRRLEGIRDQQVVARLAFQRICPVVADDQVVAPVAGQAVAAGAAEQVMEAAHLDRGGARRTEGTVALFIDDDGRGVFGKIEGVAHVGGIGHRAGTAQRTGHRGATAHPEDVAA